jgi:hypothetical protein
MPVLLWDASALAKRYSPELGSDTVDAATLAACLRHSKTPTIAGQPVVLIGSDHRLLRAAQAEGLMVLNPERLPAGDVQRFLASL